MGKKIDIYLYKNSKSSRYSFFKEVKHNSPFLKRVLCIKTSFQRTQYGKGKVGRVTVEKSNEYDLSQMIKVNINSEKPC